MHSLGPVTVSLEELRASLVSFDKLDEAFGPSSLGILIVQDLPSQYSELRCRLLSYASYLANLPSHVLESLSLPEAKYLTGWSHGKEALKSGSYDTQKGSFYVNCDFYHGAERSKPANDAYSEYPELTASNVWPPEDSLPGFRQCFEELCSLVIDTAVLVARACDRYAISKVEGYEPGYLERVVRTSATTKARLLHYYPTPANAHVDLSITTDERLGQGEQDLDTWCTTHIDHGCLTGLTSAVYIDESAHPPTLASSQGSSPPPAPLPFLSGAPDPDSGLHIRSRTGVITKIKIPSDCLAFQTGETLQLITGGKFQAVPHFVRGSADGGQVARNTLAVFTQPGLEEVVDHETGKTYAQFCREVAERFT
ncbi:MAG: hypothetical protein Q9199_001926 [Rusavskia elegans]